MWVNTCNNLSLHRRPLFHRTFRSLHFPLYPLPYAPRVSVLIPLTSCDLRFTVFVIGYALCSMLYTSLV
jgi:hypothetical protein